MITHYEIIWNTRRSIHKCVQYTMSSSDYLTEYCIVGKEEGQHSLKLNINIYIVFGGAM